MSERQYCDCAYGDTCAGLPKPAGSQCKAAIRPEDFNLKPTAPKPCNCDDVCRGTGIPGDQYCTSRIDGAPHQTNDASAAPGTKPHEILEKMADTFRERNAVYGDNFRMVAKLMAVLFPKGVPPELVVQDHFHLFELILVKLSRYAISDLTHIDSIHDLAVYAAMCESINHERNQPK